MAIKWADAPIETKISYIKASTPQGSTVQETGKFPPEKDLLKWGVKFGDNTHYSNFFCAVGPAVGDVVKVRELWTDDGSGEKKYPKWMLESDYQAQSANKGAAGFPKGAARDYTIENRQRAVDAAIAFKGDKDWDLFTTLSCADQLVEYYKSGNKPPKKTT